VLVPIQPDDGIEHTSPVMSLHLPHHDSPAHLEVGKRAVAAPRWAVGHRRISAGPRGCSKVCLVVLRGLKRCFVNLRFRSGAHSFLALERACDGEGVTCNSGCIHGGAAGNIEGVTESVYIDLPVDLNC
jgi:hypothetical protein